MTHPARTRSDHDVQAAVQDELEWAPEVRAAGIGVAVDEGTVSLSGEVDSFARRVAVKQAALRVRGVRAVVDHLEVHPDSRWSVSGSDIAKEVDHALAWAVDVPDTVQAEINGDYVTLRGEVAWDYQRDAANRAVQDLRGVAWVENEVKLMERPSGVDTRQRIVDALERNAHVDAGAITVATVGTTVILQGTVRTWAEREQVERAAWSSPFVAHVDDRIEVRVR